MFLVPISTPFDAAAAVRDIENEVDPKVHCIVVVVWRMMVVVAAAVVVVVWPTSSLRLPPNKQPPPSWPLPSRRLRMFCWEVVLVSLFYFILFLLLLLLLLAAEIYNSYKEDTYS